MKMKIGRYQSVKKEGERAKERITEIILRETSHSFLEKLNDSLQLNNSQLQSSSAMAQICPCVF